ncbi:MAG TPA: hypothetical protein VF695_07035 [Sphingomonas sp.]|jgi:hypothetical protein
MPHHYRCTACDRNEYYDGGTSRPVLQPRCLTPSCFGRLDWISSSPGPVPPPMPVGGFPATPALQLVEDKRAGPFCNYTITYDPARYLLTLIANANGKEYKLSLDADYPAGSRQYFEPPWKDRPGQTQTPIKDFFVLSPEGAKDWVLCPNLQENRVGKDVRSFGHGKALTAPVRIQVGRQSTDGQHSGSGLLHLMVSHDKQSVQQVCDVLRAIFKADSIGAIYKTKSIMHGSYRYFFLSKSKTPNCLVADLQDGYFRVITLYKLSSITNYNKFKKCTDEYTMIYSWDKNLY